MPSLLTLEDMWVSIDSDLSSFGCHLSVGALYRVVPVEKGGDFFRPCTTNRLARPSPRYLAMPCLGLPRVNSNAQLGQIFEFWIRIRI